MSQSTLNNLIYLFDRPAQPIFRPKGRDSNVSFDVPANYFVSNIFSFLGTFN